MSRKINLAAIAAVAAAGFATAALAQQGSPQAPTNAPAAERQGHMMGQGGQMGHGMMGDMMMNDPEMRAEMVQMMKNCNRMMERMSDGQRPAQKPNG